MAPITIACTLSTGKEAAITLDAPEALATFEAMLDTGATPDGHAFYQGVRLTAIVRFAVLD